MVVLCSLCLSYCALEEDGGLFSALRLGPEWRPADTAPQLFVPASPLGMPPEHPSHPNVHLT